MGIGGKKIIVPFIFTCYERSKNVSLLEADKLKKRTRGYPSIVR